MEEYKVKGSDNLDRKDMRMHPNKKFLRFPPRKRVTVNQKGKELGCLELCSPSTLKLNTKSLLNHA